MSSIISYVERGDSLMERGKYVKKEKKKFTFLTVLVIILAIIFIALAVCILMVSGLLGQITRVEDIEVTMSQEQIDDIIKETDPIDPESTLENISSDDVHLNEEAVEKVETGDHIIQVLLVGQDNESKSVRSRTDSMILCTINKNTKTLTMTSFMRDMYVKIPGYYDQRLNVAYVLGGFETLYDTMEHSFGVEVENGVAVNFASFKEVIDAVGGVDVVLTSREAAHLNGQNYTWGLVEGLNHMNGDAALAYSRIRKLDSDFGRTGRQRTVMLALLEKAKTLSLTELYALVEAVVPMVITDMSNAEIIGMAMEIAPLLSDLTIVSQRIPMDGGYYDAMIDGMAVLVPDLTMNRQLLEDTIGN